MRRRPGPPSSARLLALALGMLLSTSAAARSYDDEDRGDTRMLGISWWTSANGTGSWDPWDFLQGGGGLDFAIGKHRPSKKFASTFGDWFGVSLRLDSASRFAAGVRYGWLVGRDFHAASYHVYLALTGGALFSPGIVQSVDIDGWFGFELDQAILFRLGRPRSDRRPMLGPHISIRALPIPSMVGVDIGIRFAWDHPILPEDDE